VRGQHAEVAVAVDARWRHQGGDAVEQFQRGEDQRRTGPGRTGLGTLVAKVLAIEFAEPFHGEWRTGAVTQQPLAPRAVSGLAMRTEASDGEATVMFPMRHRSRVIARQQAAAHEDAQQPPAHALLHFGEGWRIEPGGGMEDDPARGGGVEHAVDNHTMEVQVEIEGEPKR
jgi:hypothetical protein